ncbi:MAG: DUF805 domain-containing protein [Micrococcales bacterium]|nr:MAG: DUF805 domain-containing protein [Micrococcales bacterium]
MKVVAGHAVHRTRPEPTAGPRLASARAFVARQASGRGRLARAPYWTAVGPLAATMTILTVLSSRFGAPGYAVPVLAGLAVIVPSLAATVRRLHDLNRSGWWLLILLVPVGGAAAIIVAMCLPGTFGANRYGPDPKGPMNRTRVPRPAPSGRG